MEPNSIYQYEQPHEYLATLLAAKQAKNPKFSIRAWSKQVGYKNPSILARILKGERNLKPGLASRIADSVKLSGEPRKYFVLLVLMKNAKSTAEKEIYSEALASIRPGKGFTDLTVDHFRYIADWYHFAILEMTALKGFQSDARWISKRLGGVITPSVIQTAIDRLVRLELLEKLSSGKIVRCTDKPLKAGNGTPSDAIRKHHSQMIQKGVEAIEGQNINERQILGTTLALTHAKFKKAQEIVLRCHYELMGLSAKRDEADETYQLNTQFFSLTQKDVSHETR